jgi:antibiotic biosynthesis monooxygenase (ABM) superfamily enzyme
MSTDDRHPELRTASLSDIAQRDLPRPDTVTAVIQHELKPEAGPQYEQWLARIIPVAARFPGHRGVNVIRPAPGTNSYTVTIRFDTLEHAEDWFRSDARRQLVEEVEPLLDRAEKLETVTGLEFWFMPPTATQKRARPYKQFMLTLSVIYPLTLLVPWALRPLIAAVPALQYALVDHLIVAAIIVGLMTYVVMPRYTRLVANWLYR